MKALLALTLLAVSLAAVPAASADHPPSPCAGDPDVFAVCTWHHGSFDCYSFYVLGEHQEHWDTC